MTALHLLHRHHEPHLPLQSVSAGWFWRELVPSSVAAIRSRTADTESLRLERVGVMESLRLERVEPVRYAVLH